MPKSSLLEEIIDRLDRAEQIIDQPEICEQTINLLVSAYSLWQDLDPHMKSDGFAMDLWDLQENLWDYHQDNEYPSYLLSNQISQIRWGIQSKYEGCLSDDSDDQVESNSEVEEKNHPVDDPDEENSEEKSDSDDNELIKLTKKKLHISSEPVLATPSNPYGEICSLQHMRAKQKQIEPDNEGTTSTYSVIHAELRRTSRKKPEIVKYRFNPSALHHQQRITLNHQKSTQGNTVAINLSFSIKAINLDGKEKKFTISFPLDIPRFDRKKDDSESDCYNSSHTDVDEKKSLLILKTLYIHGRAIANVDKDKKHGPTPKHNGAATDQQLIRHTEQTLAVYLCQPIAAEMIANRLSAAIRGEHPDLDYGCAIKIYHVALHIHSDKTPCGPCEYTLLGLQNMWQNNGKLFKGFTELLENDFIQKNEEYKDKKPGSFFSFIYPGYQKPDKKPCEKGIRLFTLFSADGVDGTHKRHPTPEIPAGDDSPTVIETHDRNASQKLWTINFGKPLSKQILEKFTPDFSERTIFLSGSNKTPARKKTESKVSKMNRQELDDITSNLFPDLTTFYFQKDQKQVWEFERKEISPFDAKERPNSCGFNALGITREKFLEDLFKQIKKTNVRKNIDEHIINSWRNYMLQGGKKEEAINFLEKNEKFQEWYKKNGALPPDNPHRTPFPLDDNELKQYLTQEILKDTKGLSSYLIFAWGWAMNETVAIWEPIGEDCPQLRKREGSDDGTDVSFNILYTGNHYDCLIFSKILTPKPAISASSMTFGR